MPTLGVSTLGITELAGELVHAVPVAVVTAPSGTVSDTTVTVTWTYTSPTAAVQDSFRVKLRSLDGSAQFYDSGIVVGADVTFDCPFLLSGGSSYTAVVLVTDGIEWSAEATSTFTADTFSPTEYPNASGVGSIYEVGINGTGYMLADHPDKENRYSRRVVPLQSPRFATGDTPFSQAIDRYTLIGAIDWSDGAGQKFFDRESSSTKAFFESSGIDPFTPGELTMLPEMVLKNADTFATAFVVVAGNKLYQVTANGELSAFDDPDDASATVFTITGAGAPLSVCSDGTYWYYADGSNVYRNSSAADPVTAWSTENIELIQWCGDRIVGVRQGAGSSTPNEVVVLTDAGAVVGAPQTFTMPAGTTVHSITSGDGHIWWAATRNDRSAIFGWRITTETTSYFTAFEMPVSQEARSIGYYQGNVFVRSAETTGSSQKRAVIYRCVTQDGLLSPSRLLDIEDDSIDHGNGAFAGDDRFVYFSWQAMDTESGVGAIDLASGGYTKWLKSPTATGYVRSVVQWYGRTVLGIDGYGVDLQNVPSGGDDNCVDTATLTTSISDLGTSLRKVFTEVRATFDALPSGGEVTISYSIDAGSTFTALETIDTPGTKVATWAILEQSDNIQFRIELTHTTSTATVFRTLAVKAHAVGLSDQVLVLPINCSDVVDGLNGARLPYGNGSGAQRARVLEALSQTLVRVQDVDWAVSGTAQIYEVIQVEVQSVGVFNPHLNRQQQSQVAVLTLRRSFT